MNKYQKIHTIGLREQQAWMEKIHPSFANWVEDRAGYKFLISRGPLQPTPINDTYVVRIEYRIGAFPKAFVESPELRRRNPDERQPHTFLAGNICLFRSEFRSDQQLARTVVPWLLHWLFFYESWLVTGEWQGGGTHPGEVDDDLIMVPDEVSPHRPRT